MAFEPIDKIIRITKDRFLLELLYRPDESWEFDTMAVYQVALGARGYGIKKGFTSLINSKVKDPDWYVPDSDWAKVAGYTPGEIIKGGSSENPIKERWLGVTDPKDGIGIHGTAAIDSIGTKASHGCIRMIPEQVIELYELVPKYTPIEVI